MNTLKYSATLVLASLAIALAGSEKEIMIPVRPITRAQYESILKISDGKPLISEGRLINSAISGLAGLAAGFQISKYLPNIFSTFNQASDGSAVLGSQPLCTFDTTSVNGRQIETAPYLSIGDLTNSLGQTNEGSGNMPPINCILVLDDDKPTYGQPGARSPDSLPSYAYPPPFQPIYPPSFWGFPGYSYYPPYYYGNDELRIGDAVESSLRVEPSENLQNFLEKNLRDIDTISTISAATPKKTAMKTARKPSKKPNRRPATRADGRPQNHSGHNSSRSKTKRLNFNDDFDEYDDPMIT